MASAPILPLHRNFKTATGTSSALSPVENITIGLHILHCLLNSDSNTWKVIENCDDLSFMAARDFYEEHHKEILQPDFIDSANYQNYFNGLHAIFSKALTALSACLDRVAEPGMLSARTGLHFIEPLINMASPNGCINFPRADHFLTAHVAAEVLHNIDLGIHPKYRDVFWNPKTDLYGNMYQYCHMLHHLDQERLTQDQTIRKFMDLDDMLQSAQFSSQGFVRNEQTESLNILRKYLVSAIDQAPKPVMATNQKVVSMAGFVQAKEKHAEWRAEQIAAWKQGQSPTIR